MPSELSIGSIDNHCMMERFCMLVLSCLLLAHKSESKSCQIGWTTFADDGLCYKFSPELETFDQAVATCSGFNASLTVVKTNTQQDFLVSLIPQSVTVRQFWIGLGKNDTGLFWLVDGTAYDDSAVTYGSVPFDDRCWFTIDRIDNTWKRKRCGRIYGFPAFCVKQPPCSTSSQEADCPTTTSTPQSTKTTSQPTTTTSTTTPQSTTTTTTTTTPRPTTRPTTTIPPKTTTITTTTPQPTKATSTAPIATATTIPQLTTTTDQSSTTIQTQPSTTRERTSQQTVKSTQSTTMIPSMPTNQVQTTTSQLISTPGVTNAKSTLTSIMVPTTTPHSSDNATSIETSTAPTSDKTTTLSCEETSSDSLQLDNGTNTYQTTTVKDLIIETKKQAGSQSNVAGAVVGSILGVLMLAGGIGLVVVVVRYKKKKGAMKMTRPNTNVMR